MVLQLIERQDVNKTVLGSGPARSWCVTRTNFESQVGALAVENQRTGAKSGPGSKLALEPTRWKSGEGEHPNSTQKGLGHGA